MGEAVVCCIAADTLCSIESAPAELGAEENIASAKTHARAHAAGKNQQPTILLTELGVMEKMQGKQPAHQSVLAAPLGRRPGAAELHPTVELRGHPGAHVPGASPRSFVHTLTLFA